VLPKDLLQDLESNNTLLYPKVRAGNTKSAKIPIIPQSFYLQLPMCIL